MQCTYIATAVVRSLTRAITGTTVAPRDLPLKGTSAETIAIPRVLAHRVLRNHQ
jgi:hypothetical protein